MAEIGGAATRGDAIGAGGRRWFKGKSKGKSHEKEQKAPESGDVGTNVQSKWEKFNPFTRLLDLSDNLVYWLVGICFVAAALLSLAYGVLKFYFSVRQLFLMGFNSLQITSGPNSPPEVIITFVSDLLLTLIIMEVLGTVTNYLESRKLSLKPFLYIGIISATRGILSVGARLSVSAALPADEFRNLIVELGIDAAVIIALGVTISLVRKFLEKEEAEADARKKGATEKPVMITEPASAILGSGSASLLLTPAQQTQEMAHEP